jgi:anti-anti-sigma factor
MDVHAKAGDGFTAVAISGRLDAMTAPAAEATLNGTIDGGASRLVLDLAGLEYVSSAGLRVLLAAAKRVSRLNGKLVLCALQPAVREVLEISGLLVVFGVAATVADAQALAKA